MRLNDVPLLVGCYIWRKLMVRKRKLGQQDWNGSWSPDGIQCGLSLIQSLTPLRGRMSRVERLKTKTKSDAAICPQSGMRPGKF